ncbi:MAG: glycosyltransferase family 4 protein, partial [Candidatus Micrarchaeota archaeon]
CKSERIQVIWAHDPVAGAVAYFVSKMTGVPYVYQVQSRGSLEPGPALRRWGLKLLEFFAYASPSSVVFVGENIKKEIAEKRGLQNTIVIPMAIDAGRFKRTGKPVEEIGRLKNAGKKIVCFVGRLHPVKGVDVLIRAIAGRKDVVFLVVGDGPVRKKLEKLAADLNVDAVFLGARRDVDKIMPWCDLFVLPSYSEGTSPVLLEAMASQVPVIASNVGEAGRLLSKEFLFKAGDAEELKEKITWALKERKVPKFPLRYDATVVAAELESELEKHSLK